MWVKDSSLMMNSSPLHEFPFEKCGAEGKKPFDAKLAD